MTFFFITLRKRKKSSELKTLKKYIKNVEFYIFYYKIELLF